MQAEKIQQAAQQLLSRRQQHQLTARLDPAFRPQTVEQALAIQQSIITQTDDSVAGWKCSLPDGDKLILAPLFSRTIYRQSPCPIELDAGVCKIEPEIAFVFQQDLPARESAYTEQEIIDAIDKPHLVLELIKNRYLPDQEISFSEHLADCLLNQGLYIGPAVELQQALTASEITLTLKQADKKVLSGKHPSQSPGLPLYWLVNFLTRQGTGIKAGQVVTTGSYAGVLEVSPGIDFTLQYGELGEINLCFDESPGKTAFPV